jgi:hypothetical protein
MKLKKLLLAMMCSASLSAAYADSFSIIEWSDDSIKKDAAGAYFVNNTGKLSISARISAATLLASGADFATIAADPTLQNIDLQLGDFAGLSAAPGTSLNFATTDKKSSVSATKLAGNWTVKEDINTVCAAELTAYTTDVADSATLDTAKLDLQVAEGALAAALAANPKADVTSEKQDIADAKTAVATEKKTYDTLVKTALAATGAPGVAAKKADADLKKCTKGLATLAKVSVTGTAKNGIVLNVTASNSSLRTLATEAPVVKNTPAFAALCAANGDRILTPAPVATVTIGGKDIPVNLTVNCAVANKTAERTGGPLTLTTVKLTGRQVK